MDWLEDLREDLRRAKMVKVDGYDYVVNPLSSGIPGRPSVLWLSVLEIIRIIELKGVEKVRRETGFNVKTLVKVSLKDGRIEVF